MESGVKRHRLKQGHQEPLPLRFKKQLTAKSSKSRPRAAAATTKKGEHIREGAGREDPSEMTERLSCLFSADTLVQQYTVRIIDATSSTIPLTDSHKPVPPADYLPNVQPNYWLTEKNYLKWSQFVQTFLKGKGKLSHLLGIRPPKEDPKYCLGRSGLYGDVVVVELHGS
ncbi:hypothetical protein LWI28_004330 [Acer negundo]|uniref:Retrotransposon Copia-like N-terminal domain-containing protein n=1 Tax=Acer negundo TaxID=4023 RepID=A0AAD5JHK3_ACENE|nr:hypothetical protein LWI28_004330 [Acer negundo]